MSQTIARRAALPVVPSIVCPAASPIAGVTPERSGVICRVMLRDREKERGLDMHPGQLAIARDGSDGVLMTAKSDPSTIERMCCGDAVPVLDDLAYMRDSYTVCPVWQAEKKRIADGRHLLAGGGLAPEPVSSYDDGMASEPGEAPPNSTLAAKDPWAQAHRDRMLFDPEGRG